MLTFRCAQNVRLIYLPKARVRGEGATDGQIFPIYNELKDRSQAKMTGVIVGSIGTAATVYEIVSPDSLISHSLVEINADSLARYCAYPFPKLRPAVLFALQHRQLTCRLATSHSATKSAPT